MELPYSSEVFLSIPTRKNKSLSRHCMSGRKRFILKVHINFFAVISSIVSGLREMMAEALKYRPGDALMDTRLWEKVEAVRIYLRSIVNKEVKSLVSKLLESYNPDFFRKSVDHDKVCSAHAVLFASDDW